MALFSVDPQNVLGKTVDEAGVYNVKVSSSSQYKESSTGKPMAVLDFEVVDGKYAGGKIRYDNIVWDDSTTEKMYQSITRFNTVMVAAGVPSRTEVNSIKEFVAMMFGKTLAVRTFWKQSKNGNYYLTVNGYENTLSKGSQPNGETRPVAGTKQAGNGFNAGFSGKDKAALQRGADIVNGFSNNSNQPANNQQGQPNLAPDNLPF